LTVTLEHEDGLWTATARRRDGTVLARRYPVPAPRALRALRLTHSPPAASALDGLLAGQHEAAVRHARRLGAELVEAQDGLVELAALLGSRPLPDAQDTSATDQPPPSPAD